MFGIFFTLGMVEKQLKSHMKNNFLRSNQAIILLWIVIGADAISGISSLMQIHLLGQLNKGIQVSDQQLELNDLREAIVGLLYLTLSLHLVQQEQTIFL